MRKDAVPAQQAPLPIQAAIDDFVLHQRAMRNSPKTIYHYRNTLTKLRLWMEKNGFSTVDAITGNAVRLWLAEMSDATTPRGTKMKSGTVWTHYKNSRAFFNFLELEEELGFNPMKRVKPPRREQEILPSFTKEEIKRLEEATKGKDETSVRNRAMVYVLLDSGCRLSELTNLKMQDINLQTGAIMIRHGKGGKDRMTRIGSTALRALNRYLRIRPRLAEEPIWHGPQGTLTQPGIRIILERLGKRCGVHCHAHKFRRTTALTMLRNGCDVFSIKSLLGHSDLQVLQRYLAQTEADITVAHERFGPLDHMR